MGPDGLFVSQRTGSHSAGIHVPFTNCFVCRWFCVVHDPKPPLHSTIDSVLANSKTQNAFLFTVNAIFHHDYPLAVEPGNMPRPLEQKKLGEILYLLICSFLPYVLVVAQSSSEIPEGLTNNPVFCTQPFFAQFATAHCDTIIHLQYQHLHNW